MNTFDAVRLYQSIGWTVVPVHFKSKSPTSNSWQEAPPADTVLKVYQTRDELNIGVYLGTRSGGLVDIDLDCVEAVNAAESFLPKTVTYGRLSNPRSHWLYKVAGAEPEYRMFKSPGGAILEIRTSNPGGKQSVFPPSVHESGEQIAFTEPFDPAGLTTVTVETLTKAVSRLAAFVIVYRHWPEQGTGQRHSATMALAGALIRAGFEDDELLNFISLLSRQKDEEDPADRMRAVRDTIKKARTSKSKKLVGFTTLAEFIGEDAKDALISCLFGDDDGSSFFDGFNKEYFWVRHNNSVLIAHRTESPMTGRKVTNFLSLQTFKDAMAAHYTHVGTGDNKKYVNVAKYWLTTPGIKTEYLGLTFSPSDKPIPSNIFNTWNGYSVDPKPGDWSLLRQHVFENVANSNQDHFDWIMAFMADSFQRPEVKPAVALILQGKQGTGKSEFAKAIVSLVADHSTTVSSQSHVVGRFNGHMQDILFLVANEAFFAGDRQHENIIKAYVSDTTIQIERKGENTIEMPSCMRLIMTSNANWVVPKAYDDRRYAVFRVGDGWRNRRDLFKPMIDQLNDGGREALLYDLLNWKYDPNFATSIPVTDAGEEQRDLTKSQVEAWWEDRLNSGHPCPTVGSWAREGRNGIRTWPEMVAKQALYTDFRETYGKSSRYERESSFWADFYRMVPPDCKGRGVLRTVGPFKTGETQDKPIRVAFMKMPCWADAKDSYCTLRNRKVEWDDYTPDDQEEKEEY